MLKDFRAFIARGNVLDLAVAVIMEKVGDATTNPDEDFGVRLSRLLYK